MSFYMAKLGKWVRGFEVEEAVMDIISMRDVIADDGLLKQVVDTFDAEISDYFYEESKP